MKCTGCENEVDGFGECSVCRQITQEMESDNLYNKPSQLDRIEKLLNDLRAIEETCQVCGEPSHRGVCVSRNPGKRCGKCYGWIIQPKHVCKCGKH